MKQHLDLCSNTSVIFVSYTFNLPIHQISCFARHIESATSTSDLLSTHAHSHRQTKAMADDADAAERALKAARAKEKVLSPNCHSHVHS